MLTDILWSIIIIIVYFQFFKRLVKMKKIVKREIVLDEIEEKIS